MFVRILTRFQKAQIFSLPDKMYDVIFEVMTVAEEVNERGSEIIRTLNQHAYDLEEQEKKWVAETMKKVKEFENWIRDANGEIDKFRAERDRLTDVFRIR